MPENPENTEMAQDDTPDFVERMNRLSLDAAIADKDDLVFEKDKAYNPFNLFYLDKNEVSPISGSKGYGEWTLYPFGRVRLVSCASGTQKGNAFLSMQVDLNQGYSLVKPVLTAAASNAYTARFFYPKGAINPDISPHEIFQNAVFFPVVFDIIQKDAPLDFEVSGTFDICAAGGCTPYPVSAMVRLSPDESYATPICAKMVQEFQKAYTDMPAGYIAQARMNTAGDIQMYFDFPKEIGFLNITIDDAFKYDVISKKIDGGKAYVKIRPAGQIKPDDTLALRINSSLGKFQTRLVVSGEKHLQTLSPFPKLYLFFIGFVFLFFSSFWSGLFMCKTHTQKQFLDHLQNLKKAIFATMILFAFLWYFKIILPDTLVGIFPHSYLIILGLLGFFALKPPTTPLIVCASFWMIPKPYLEPLLPTSAAHGWLGILTCLILTLYLVGPVNIAIGIHKQLFQKLRQIPDCYKLYAARAPFVILFIWLATALAMNAFLKKDVYSAEKMHDAVDQGKAVFLMIEEPACLRCALNKISIETGYGRLLKQRGELAVFTLQKNDPMAEGFLKNMGETQTPVNILFTDKNKEGIVIPKTIPYYDLNRYLLNKTSN
ncbi:MAG: hypothetical protein LBU87_03835 [Lactobacillales bacterium]|nr:hypothetical protein [Lactobacillales bacterium]